MSANEFKRELSKLSGVDFFNPKYRELFKKAFSDEKAEEEEKPKAPDDETEKRGRETPDHETNEADAPEEEIAEKETPVEEQPDEPSEDGQELDEPEHDEGETAEEHGESEEIAEEQDAPQEDKDSLLLEAKIENALLRGGVREEKLGAAMRLAKSEIKRLEDLDRVRDILRDFPEWVRGYGRRGFGMDVDNGSDNLTEEEKRLKEMGINPRD